MKECGSNLFSHWAILNDEINISHSDYAKINFSIWYKSRKLYDLTHVDCMLKFEDVFGYLVNE